MTNSSDSGEKKCDYCKEYLFFCFHGVCALDQRLFLNNMLIIFLNLWLSIGWAIQTIVHFILVWLSIFSVGSMINAHCAGKHIFKSQAMFWNIIIVMADYTYSEKEEEVARCAHCTLSRRSKAAEQIKCKRIIKWGEKNMFYMLKSIKKKNTIHTSSTLTIPPKLLENQCSIEWETSNRSYMAK